MTIREMIRSIDFRRFSGTVQSVEERVMVYTPRELKVAQDVTLQGARGATRTFRLQIPREDIPTVGSKQAYRMFSELAPYRR